MKRNIGFLLILGASTLSLGGCSLLRVAGPCYGVGCPTFTTSGQPKVAAVPKAPDGNAQAQKTAAAEPASAEASQAGSSQAPAGQSDANQAKPGAFTRMLTALHLHSKS
jgi:hypothetical protein